MIYKFTLNKDYTSTITFNYQIAKESYTKQIIFNGKVMGVIFVHIKDKFNSHVVISVNKDYSWDGCSPKFKIGNYIIGTWDGSYNHLTRKPACYYPSLIHDFLLQFSAQHDLDLYTINLAFYRMLQRAKFSLRYLYYASTVIYLNIKALIKRL